MNEIMFVVACANSAWRKFVGEFTNYESAVESYEREVRKYNQLIADCDGIGRIFTVRLEIVSRNDCGIIEYREVMKESERVYTAA
jgi:hypothetical protein